MATLLEYECPSCGGALQFDSGLQLVKCPFCDSEFPVDTFLDRDAFLEEEAPQQAPQEETQDNLWQEEEKISSYLCQSCGGEIICDESTAATSCPYCDSPVVMKERLAGTLRPDLVIPFKLDKEAAKAALQKHVSGKVLLPKCFKSENRIEKLQGIYVPFWLYDAQADGDVHYKATKVRTWSDSNYNYTQTRHFRLRRAGTVDFEAVPVDASSKMANELMESIEPYDLSQAVDFQTAYLAGYLADKYDVTAETTMPRAEERMKLSTGDALRNTAQGYTTVSVEHSNIKIHSRRVRYALLPVWMLNTHYQGKDYVFAMNGQTGKMVGDLPMDKGAYWLWFTLISVIGAAAAYVLGLLLG